jgi:acyl-CoA hydrolase
VALDAHCNRVPVPQVIPESDDEKRRYEEADKRRTYRLQIREKSRL